MPVPLSLRPFLYKVEIINSIRLKAYKHKKVIHAKHQWISTNIIIILNFLQHNLILMIV